MTDLSVTPAGIIVLVTINLIFTIFGGGLVRFYSKSISYYRSSLLFFWSLLKTESIYLILNIASSLADPRGSIDFHKNSTILGIVQCVSLAYFINRDLKKYGVANSGWFGIGGKVVVSLLGLVLLLLLLIASAQYFL